jgi:drug/metabolite transporter (DMT)-like permease
MRPTTRDNLIYLGVGFGIVSLLVADIVHAESHGQEMWLPSNFAFRIVASTGLLAYYLGKMMRRGNATRIQIVAGVVLGSAINLGIVFMIRRAVGQLSGATYGALTIVELFFVALLSEKVALFLFPRRGTRDEHHIS